MSFQSDRAALRLALQSSLNDVLLDVNIDSGGIPSRTVEPAPPSTNLFTRPSQSHLASLTAGLSGSSFDSPFLPSQQGSLVAQSLALSGLPPPSAAAAAPSTTPMGMSTTDGLLLAVAAANERKMLLQQARDSLLKQQIAEESKRVLLEKSYIDMLRNASAAPGKSLAGALPSVLPSLQPKAPPRNPITENKTLEALGSNLRAASDPYIDVSDMADPDEDDPHLRRTRGGISEPFPEKLHRMLKEVEKQGQTEIVSFFSHGRAFGIHDMDKFVSEIMPKYFKQTKWNSFARQLNLYGFIRICSGPDAGGYYHELFLKGRPNLCLHMRRVGVPSGEDRRKFRPKNKHAEPDFYAMKRLATA